MIKLHAWSFPFFLVLAFVGVSHGASPCEVPNKKGIRFAVYNASLNRASTGELKRELVDGNSEQAKRISAVIRRVDPDVLLVLELDKGKGDEIASIFHNKYLRDLSNASFNPYPYSRHFESNTGVKTQFDLDGDGQLGGPGDAQGFGHHLGQYAFALFSRHPIDQKEIHEFKHLLWKDLPNSRVTEVTKDGSPWYSQEALSQLRLSSKNHVALPIYVGEHRIWAVMAHPTPPVFDGNEDRNGFRNFDEIALIKMLISGQKQFTSDSGVPFLLAPNDLFVVMGDLNADPNRGQAQPGAIGQLLYHERINSEAAVGLRAPSLRSERGEPSTISSTFGLRVDYILPSKELVVKQAGVCQQADGNNAPPSDHFMIWSDLSFKK